MSTTTPVQDRLAGSWNFAAAHSSADFAVKYVVSTFRGSLQDLTATLENGVLSGTATVASVKVKDDNLTGHLMAPDFFDAEQFPEISFHSTSITTEGEAVTVDGELTLKGVTKPIHASGTLEGPAQDFMGNTRLGFTLEATIDRTDYGVSWNAELPSGGPALSNDVTLQVELEFHQAA
jgi:polyisoprenoid-binding protein YceI